MRLRQILEHAAAMRSRGALETLHSGPAAGAGRGRSGGAEGGARALDVFEGEIDALPEGTPRLPRPGD